MHRILIVSVALLASACATKQPSLNDGDSVRFQDAVAQAYDLPVGRQTVWGNIVTGNGGQVRVFSNAEPAGCRNLLHRAYRPDRTAEVSLLKVCRTPEGELDVTKVAIASES